MRFPKSFGASAQEIAANLAAGPTIWSWQSDAGRDAFYHVGCLTETELYIRTAFTKQKSWKALLEKLYSGMPPEESFNKKTAQVIPLAEITELRCGRKACVLDIYQRDKKHPFSLETDNDAMYCTIFEAVRKQIAPMAQPQDGHLSAGSSSEGPIVGIVFSCIIGAVLIPIVLFTSAGDGEAIAGKGFIEGIKERPLAVLGLPGAIGITVALLAGSIAWLMHRRKNPLPAVVVTLAEDAAEQ